MRGAAFLMLLGRLEAFTVFDLVLRPDFLEEVMRLMCLSFR